MVFSGALIQSLFLINEIDCGFSVVFFFYSKCKRLLFYAFLTAEVINIQHKLLATEEVMKADMGADHTGKCGFK